MSLLPGKQMLTIVSIQSTKYRKNERFTLYLHNMFTQLVEMCFAQHVKITKKYILTKKFLISTIKVSAKPALTCLKFHPTNKSRHWLVCGDGTHVLQKKTSRDYKEDQQSFFLKIFSANHNQARPILNRKRTNSFHLWHKRVELPLSEDMSLTFDFCFISYNLNIYSSRMVFSVSNQGIQSIHDFGPD